MNRVMREVLPTTKSYNYDQTRNTYHFARQEKQVCTCGQADSIAIRLWRTCLLLA